MSTQCSSVKRSDNKRCLCNTIMNSEYCFFHDPAMARQRAEARKSGGYNRCVHKRIPQHHRDVKSVNDINKILESSINEALALEPSHSRLKAIGYLCQIALKG